MSDFMSDFEAPNLLPDAESALRDLEWYQELVEMNEAHDTVGAPVFRHMLDTLQNDPDRFYEWQTEWQAELSHMFGDDYPSENQTSITE